MLRRRARAKTAVVVLAAGKREAGPVETLAFDPLGGVVLHAPLRGVGIEVAEVASVKPVGSRTEDDLAAALAGPAGLTVLRTRPKTLFVLDATTGQNGLHQAKAFHEAVGLTGIVLTKLDSTAKGGIVFAIEHDLGVPVRFIGVGEKAGDLLPFDPAAFVKALFAN